MLKFRNSILILSGIAVSIYSYSRKSLLAENGLPTQQLSQNNEFSLQAKASAAITQLAGLSLTNRDFAYEEKMKKLMEEMPTLTQQSRPRTDENNQIHGVQSDEIIEGQKLAEIQKLSLQNSDKVASTQTLYADCAERQDLANSVRAICFMHAMELTLKLKNPEMIVQLNVPADVRALALKLVN